MASNQEKREGLKVVVVGDGAVGKTCLCTVFAKKVFPADYVPTVFETHPISLELGGRELSMNVWDTAGQEEYDNIRQLTYPNTDMFLVCFNSVNRITFDNLKNKWMLELNSHAPKVPKLLVGTMADRKNEKSLKNKMPTKSEINKLVKDFKMVGFIECSAKEDPESVTSVFEQAGLKALGLDGQNSPKDVPCFPFLFSK
eukprot:GFUD01003493.1.p1 GENE.GFUD01003493.1~~GFUD01003493.1.p1  ORF type:complete len:199 (+),score=67.11 GFUD01003493.1:72-668(+)